MFRKVKFYANQLVQQKDDAKRIAGAARSTLLGAVLLAPALAMAGGGLDSATEGANTFKIWLYSFLGVCASCVLLWKGAECWADRSHWSEFVTLGGKVAVVGAVVGVLAPYLWNLFT
ncbi:hypothetical protein ACFQ3P_39950 [Paraburkholderia sabiae]|uniref:Conjugal transfer protein n=1 Tax=Paraburkholderia sabiae TaxID=273251 RepID=A0ABU9QQW6_9BURK|nr:hypothetical protein [Paraburkholderia sabiae]WJZ79643.1 hypothetical protein QEN71_40950 [Paraburkholderia sabiae]CAD6562878.1 hypothetical protein LMG24235_08120 [Paraburkholderia sabiae]